VRRRERAAAITAARPSRNSFSAFVLSSANAAKDRNVLRAFDREIGNLVPCELETRASWIHARDPTREEIDAVAARRGVSPHALEQALDANEVARVSEASGGVVLIVLRVPWTSGAESENAVRSTAFAILVAENTVTTVTRDDGEMLEALVRRVADRFEPSIQLAVASLRVVAETFLHHLRGIEERIDHLEVKIEKDLSNKTIVALLLEQKNLIHLESALAADKIVVDELRKRIPDGSHGDLDDAANEMMQAIATARVERDVLAQTMSAFGSIVSNNLNDAMKFLSSVTIVLMVPTIVAGFWGMNVALPAEQLPLAFWLLMAGTAVASALTTWMLWRRGWL
jgi:magnesium transporter